MCTRAGRPSWEPWRRRGGGGIGGMSRETADGPHAKRRGWLKNGNPAGNPHAASRCGAKTRHGGLCRAPAMPNRRCRLHRGKSTGPRTAEGLARCRTANWKHGMYSKEALAERQRVRKLLRRSAELIAALKQALRPKWGEPRALGITPGQAASAAGPCRRWLIRRVTRPAPPGRRAKRRGGAGVGAQRRASADPSGGRSSLPRVLSRRHANRVQNSTWAAGLVAGCHAGRRAERS